MQRAQPVDKPVDQMWGARGEPPMTESDLAKVWARSLDELAETHIEPAQRAWLQLTRPLALVENTALIATPNEFVKEQLETRLRALITHALSRELGRSIQLAVTVDPTAITAATVFPAAPAEPGPGGGQAAGRDDHTGVPRPLGSSLDGAPNGRVPRPADPLGPDSLGSIGSLGPGPLGSAGLPGVAGPGSQPVEGQPGHLDRS